ncbi:MAG TPA: selenocysteine-specific translation elongation factor [Bryobacteraceae bacterium]|jgi:selenocysteine-specific elongation factor|nr:selenocysteine-specific translation elongation factor [Bryobacteraceae bacterium]
MDGSRGVVIGTAGHIDHGKTSLIRALTGIDTDRLAEEKKRGISIDLGFAHLTLPDGQQVSFVDVPGHERFIKNMLAGACGIQAVLLVIAADECVKPQTREHFDICRLLGIEHGVIVLSKADLVSTEQMHAACRQARALCAGSFLEHAEIIEFSAVDGRGIEELKGALSRVIERIPPRHEGGLARLPIDRCFALKGFGTIVTGTLWSGRLQNGDTVQILPSKRLARVRGLQVHGRQVPQASAGQRTAVNLTGVEPSLIQRGFVLAHADGLDTTGLLEVAIDWLDASEIPARRRQYLLHLGTAEITVALKIYPRALNGLRTFARLWLTEPLLAFPGDRFVLRRLSPPCTVAGGTVIDPFPPARLNRVRAFERAQTLADADPAKRIQVLVEESMAGRRLKDLVRVTGFPPEELKRLIAENSNLVLADGAQRAMSKAWIDRRRQKLAAWLKEFHGKYPSQPGAPIAAARLGLEPGVAAVLFEDFPAIRIHGDTISLATHTAQFSRSEHEALSRIEQAFRNGAFQPPAASEVLKSTGTDPSKARALLEALLKRGRLIRVSEELVFHADVIAHICKSLAAHKGRRFSVPEFKTWTQISRKYAIPLLEYLDRQKVTKREGDNRVVL